MSLIVGRGGSQAAVSTPIPDPGYWPTDVWRTSMPEAQGMDSELLAKMFEYVEQNQINLHSVLIVRNSYVVAEAYFHPYTADTPHQTASVTKNVISILLGMAIDRGAVRGVDQPLLDFFPGRWISQWPVWVCRLHRLAHSLGGVAFRPVKANVETKR